MSILVSKMSSKSCLVIVLILLTNVITICSTLCDENSDFLCKTFDNKNKTCQKFGQKCSNGVSMWNNYPSSAFSVAVEQNFSNNFLFDSRVNLFNVTRLRFELRKFENSTFFRRIFDVGIFRPLDEMTEKHLGR